MRFDSERESARATSGLGLSRLRRVYAQSGAFELPLIRRTYLQERVFIQGPTHVLYVSASGSQRERERVKRE